jgi:hypothetical protein
MPPPEVWGPAVWTLFHTLAEKINVNAYPAVFPSLFNMIIKICKFLPCPECSNDASIFLAKVKVSELKTKESLKATLCIFHNTVNAKKRKPIFIYSNIGVYGKYNLIRVINNFISQYQTKGNMKLLTESFQRQFIIKEFKNWFMKTIKAFYEPAIVPPPLPQATVEEPIEEPVTSVEEPIELQEQEISVSNIEEPAIEDSISDPVEEPVSNIEEQVEEPVSNIGEPIEEPIEVEEQEEPVSNIEEPAIEDSISEPLEEPVTSVEEPIEEPLEEPIEEPLEEPLEEPIEEPIEEPAIEDSISDPLEEQASVEENISETTDVILDTNIETTQVSKKKNKKNKNKNKK